jgi:hypothetical protein
MNPYPTHLFEARRVWFVAKVQELPAETVHRIAVAIGVTAEIATDGELASPLEARLEVIEDALQDPFMDKQTAFTLLEEMAEIQNSLEKG